MTVSSALESTLRLCIPCLVLALACGCGRLLDDDHEGFSSFADEADDEDELEEEPGSGGEISESCWDGIVQPGEICQVQAPAIPSGIDPCALEIADFDSDGRPDLAVPNSDWLQPPSATHYSHVLRGFGNGNFADAAGWDAGEALPVGIAVGDFDGDADVDIATANYESNSAFVLGNDGGMSFSPPIGETVPGAASTIGAGDITSDGIDDLVVTLPDSIALLRGGPGGPELIGTLAMSGTPGHSRLADLDSDGALDLAVVTQGTFGEGELILLHGAGDGSFSEQVDHPIGNGAWWVSAGDLDMDGDLDLAIAETNDNTVSLLMGNDQGGFSDRFVLDVCVGPQSVEIADMNVDGHNDLVIACRGSDLIEMWVQVSPGGVFERARWWATGSTPVSARVGDLNLDGVPDIAWANQLSNTVGLVLSHP